MFEEADEDLEEREFPDPDRDGGQDEVRCRGCGRTVYVDAPVCPHCGVYDPSTARSGLPLWVIGVALLAAALILLMLLGR